MPNRYEREIEEILRNLEQTDPKTGKSQKFGERFRRRPGPGPNLRAPQPRPISWNLSTSERLLIGTIICAMLAGAYAYLAGQNVITLILALAGFVGVVVVALSNFTVQSRRPRSVRYGNTTITPLRRGPWDTIKTQWNLLLLKMRYRRKDKDE
ncbi:hypothetical protein [Dictyobacter kobayashii]|uniref:DUF3040 domain-containing protein n=1 Tax=Dictyobacter kobayashii TaxID=2014872 RepID=A0A402ADH6_9CHLR|nr:hypothetical protein [Dictyobacter kobayashii]GCE17154.1 hypothetical protein KDK_09540 [Dictyobacter kobayashii]